MRNYTLLLKPSLTILNFRKRGFSAVHKLLSMLMLCLLTTQIVSAQSQQFDEARIRRATVFIMQARAGINSPVVTCIGSGTIVNRSGLILTNAHNTVPNRSCPGDILIIALTIRPDEPPVPLYRAEIIQSDSGLDLALLRITQQNDGRLIDPNLLSLPFVELGDSSTVNLDSTVTIVGYPSFGDDPISIERGAVSGFSAEPSGGIKSWIKTSITIPGTMSGGGAYSSNGQLIGIPTTAPTTADSAGSTCLIFQDTNNDGLANSSDSCVPIGGTINSLRPSSFVSPLLRAASLGISTEVTTQATVPSRPLTGVPTFSRLFFAPTVNEAGMPTTAIRTLPSGSTNLYLFFNYDNMTPETVYEVRVTIDGIVNNTFGLSPVRWSGGQSGLWYVGTTGQPLPNGFYEFTLLINGVSAESARLVVGRSDPTPSFSDIVFGLEDTRGNVLGNGFVLPVGTTASARFIYRNMTPETAWTAIWYREGQEIPGSRTPDGTVWSMGNEGVETIRIQSPTGLLPGNYRLDLYIDNRLAATSNFTLAGAQDGSFARIFNNLRLTTADSAQEASTAAAITSFSTGTESLYAVFDWQLIAAGTAWTLTWYIDDNIFFQQTRLWSNTETGENFTILVTSPDGIPDGTYRLELKMSNLLFASQTGRVGVGLLPIDRFAVTSGVQMSGQIMDSVTREGIPGATFVIITEDYSAAEFNRDWRQDQIYAIAVTDRNGRFEIDRLLQPGIQYSIVIVAEGYLPIAADAIEFTLENNPVEVPIYLTRG